jgi:hypothetical protein
MASPHAVLSRGTVKGSQRVVHQPFAGGVCVLNSEDTRPPSYTSSIRTRLLEGGLRMDLVVIWDTFWRLHMVESQLQPDTQPPTTRGWEGSGIDTTCTE